MLKWTKNIKLQEGRQKVRDTDRDRKTSPEQTDKLQQTNWKNIVLLSFEEGRNKRSWLLIVT